jgi:hypothetical protein
MALSTALDAFVPIYQFSEKHSIEVDAPPELIFASIKGVTAREIRFFRTLTWVRRFGRPGPESILNAPPDEPILEVAVRTGFITLADIANRELVVGIVLVAPRGSTRKRTPSEFNALTQPGVTKGAINFLIEPHAACGCTVTTETRVVATNLSTRCAFAAYWTLIYPGSALIRRMWLRAVKRRAEAAA